MRNRVRLICLFTLVAGAACSRAVNTLPPPVSPTAPVQYYDLEVPQDLEVKAADFSASTYSEVSGTEFVTSSVSGRAFVKLYAVHRTSGEQFLLVYEDIARRKQPIHVIRFHRGTERARPDSVR